MGSASAIIGILSSSGRALMSLSITEMFVGFSQHSLSNAADAEGRVEKYHADGDRSEEEEGEEDDDSGVTETCRVCIHVYAGRIFFSAISFWLRASEKKTLTFLFFTAK